MLWIKDIFEPILLGIIVTAILHVLFLWTFPLSKTQWKAAEYLWLALSAAGVFGGLAQLKKENLAFDFPGLKKSMEEEKLYDVEYIAFKLKLLCENPKWLDSNYFKEDLSFKFRVRRVQEEYSIRHIACEEGVRVHERLKNVPELLDSIPPISFQGEMRLGPYYRMLRELNRKISGHNHRASTLKAIEEDSQKTVKDLHDQNLYMWLLIIGFSVRITKTSGEIQVERREKRSKIGEDGPGFD